MFKRAHHNRIQSLLTALDAGFLGRNDCFFGGGTAIVLALDEYRESVDIDFLCASQDGYRDLRNTITSVSLGAIFARPVELAREVRTDRYGIRTFLLSDGVPVKFEIVSEGRIHIDGLVDPGAVPAEDAHGPSARGPDPRPAQAGTIKKAPTHQGWRLCLTHANLKSGSA
jgi:hypothetical protein